MKPGKIRQFPVRLPKVRFRTAYDQPG